jgi:hypothetical protein
MRSMSVLLRRPLSLVMVILLLLPVPFSMADTLRMPLASMSKVTLIWGTPRGAGGMPDSSNLPSRLLSRVMERSPSYTCGAGAERQGAGVRRQCEARAAAASAASSSSRGAGGRGGGGARTWMSTPGWLSA